ncbi:putative small multi-drug export [Alkaliphilus metalliredigens QYMF]|uniref:Putative small multi-drug export n=1 Tax=Alkaliphilus metalliredigens (strain QYMF) TaxID=293826 RepID=A6TL72_ALKMQ|nr:small multi-drug export protein [Alkaliphilus metalliredigens]ABR46940.1 putative small multi-drug export [Alkaliphilus metalliredigens QYMF]
MESAFQWMTKELMVLFIAALPIMELRGAIPIGVSMGIHPLHATILGVVGSLLPVPFLLLFLEPVFEKLKKSKFFFKFIQRTVKKTRKSSERIRKYSTLGLVLFVAIPLPTTGVWSGCLAAKLLAVPFKYAMPAIAVGASIAGTIMFILSYIAIKI